MALEEQERTFVGRLAGKIERSHATSGRTFRSPARSASAAPRLMGQDARQQVVVKVSYVKMCTKQGMSKARAHLSYLERDGVARDGSPGKLFDERGEVDRAEFWKRSEQDPHQFRIIISPEQGHKMELERFAVCFVKNLEAETGHKLEWCGVAHHNTDHPHVHIIVRGRAASQQEVRFSRAMISHGMRDAARDLATIELGERTRMQQYEQQRRELHHNGPTKLDRLIEYEADAQRNVKLNEGLLDRDGELRRNVLERLKYLEQLELARRVAHDRWQLAQDLKERLQAHQHNMDIHKRLIEAKCNPITAERCALEPDKQVSGKVLARGLADEVRGSEYMVIVQKNGCARYVELERERERERASVGDVVTVQRTQHNKMEVQTHGALAHQVKALHPTWLDTQQAADARALSFASELNQALRARREELERLGVVKSGEAAPAPEELSRRLAHVEFNQWLEQEHAQRRANAQRPLQLVRDIERFEGRVREEPVSLKGARFLVVEGKQRDTLVPLTKELWAQRGQKIEGHWERDPQTGRGKLVTRIERDNEVER